MIEHILLIRWTQQATPQAIEAAFAGLRQLKEKIPGILDLSAGQNFSPRSKGYTHALTIRFKDRPSLDAYFPHPEHRRVVENLINPFSEEALVADYEF